VSQAKRHLRDKTSWNYILSSDILSYLEMSQYITSSCSRNRSNADIVIGMLKQSDYPLWQCGSCQGRGGHGHSCG
jgi:hypothetical protein